MYQTNSRLRVFFRFTFLLLCFALVFFETRSVWGSQATLALATGRRATGVVVSEQLLNQLGLQRGAIDGKHGLAEFKVKANGLSILLLERHSAPVVTIMMLYRVGSRNEAVGYTGATHFLEHMMFKGSSRFDPRKGTGIDDVLKPIGGMNNATTWFDRTSYFEVLPANYLDQALSFESDRMRHLLLRQRDKASEMTVVRNELERSENDPRSVLETQVFATAFVEHPYHHPTIGWRSDVEGVPLQRLRQFHDDFYWPNNASLLIVGDFNQGAALRSVAKYFGPIPRAPAPIPAVYTAEPPQQGERRFVVQKGEDLPKVDVAFHISKAADPDIYPVAVIESLLGDNTRQSSRLYKRLVDTGLASDVSASSYELRDPGLFVVSATVAGADTKPVALEEAMVEEVERLKTEAVKPEELKRAKLALVKRNRLSTIDPLGLAEQIGEAIAAVDWKFWSTYEEKIEAVTASDITRVANKYFQRKNRTVGYYLPKDSPPSAKLQPPSLQASPPGPSRYRQSNEDSQPVNRGSKSFASPAFALPRSNFAQRVRRKVLPNGLTVLVLPIPATGIVAVSGKVRAGNYFATQNKELIPEVLSDMLTKGTAKYSKEQMADQLDNMGSSLEFEAGNFWMEFTSNVVNSDLGQFLPLLSEVLERPLLPDEELQKSKKILQAELKEHMVDTREVARNALSHALYKPGDVYYENTFQEKLSQVPGITAAELSDFHKSQFTPANTVLAVVGDVDPDKAFALVQENLGSWTGPAKAAAIIVPAEPQPVAARRIQVQIADKENVDISLGHPVDVNLKSKEYFAAQIANSALGHSPFSTRLAPIREKYGLTYDIFSAFQDPAYGGAPWLIECSANPANVDRVLSLIHSIVAEYLSAGIKADELKLETKHLAGEFLVNLRNPDDIAKYLSEYAMLGLGPERIDQFGEHLNSVSLQQANEAIRKYFRLDHGVTTMAGSMDSIQKK